MISGEQPIFTVFPDSLMGFCGLSLMAFGWTRGCPALPDSWCWCGETHRHQNSCLETAGGLQGVRFRFMMNSRLMTVLSITSADLQTVEGGREGRFVLLFKIELLFYYFFYNCDSDSSQGEKEKTTQYSKHKEGKRRNYKTPMIFQPTWRWCGASQTFHFYWMDLFPWEWVPLLVINLHLFFWSIVL